MPNRLSSETSPYLLQHAENPVDWYPWGPEAFERARCGGQAGARLDRLRRVPLVPRHGARDVRGRVGGRVDERVVRLREGRPRGAPGRRRDLHGRRAGDDRPRRLAAERVPAARRARRSTPARTSRRSRATGCRRGRRCCRRCRESWVSQRAEIDEAADVDHPAAVRRRGVGGAGGAVRSGVAGRRRGRAWRGRSTAITAAGAARPSSRPRR